MFEVGRKVESQHEQSKGEPVTSRWARLARGWFAAVFATALAATSHVFAGGASPSFLALILTLTFSGFVCVALTGKALSPHRQALAIAASQFAFHGFFGTVGSGAMAGVVTEVGVTTASTTHNHLVPTLLNSADTMGAGAMGMVPTHPSTAMWVGHAIATVLAVTILRHGEKAFWGLLQLTGLVVRSLFARVTPAPIFSLLSGTTPIRGVTPTPRILRLLRTALLYRGPPVCSIA